MLGAGANVHHANQYGDTALISASWNDDHKEIVTALLGAGANVHHANQYGYTALIWASEKGHTEIVRALLEAGAGKTINHPNQYGCTALIWASQNGQEGIVRALLAMGAGVDHVTKKGNTALSLARNKGHAGIISLLEAAAAKERKNLAAGELVTKSGAQNSKPSSALPGKAPVIEMRLMGGSAAQSDAGAAPFGDNSSRLGLV